MSKSQRYARPPVCAQRWSTAPSRRAFGSLSKSWFFASSTSGMYFELVTMGIHFANTLQLGWQTDCVARFQLSDALVAFRVAGVLFCVYVLPLWALLQIPFGFMCNYAGISPRQAVDGTCWILLSGSPGYWRDACNLSIARSQKQRGIQWVPHGKRRTLINIKVRWLIFWDSLCWTSAADRQLLAVVSATLFPSRSASFGALGNRSTRGPPVIGASQL